MDKKKITEYLRELGAEPPETVVYGLTDSTNTRAREYAKARPECKSPVVFIADGQSAGRGRRGRSFVSNIGAGIYISFLLFPANSAEEATAVTAKAAVALSRAVERVSSAAPRIKWVNDLYLGGKKLAGILTEGETDGDGKMRCLVCGMGINVYKNAVSEEISDIATSIESETGETVERELLAANIIREFLFAENAQTDDKVFREYRSRSFILGSQITVMKLTESYTATAIDIGRDYSLIIERDGGVRERLFTGEVSLKITK